MRVSLAAVVAGRAPVEPRFAGLIAALIASALGCSRDVLPAVGSGDMTSNASSGDGNGGDGISGTTEEAIRGELMVIQSGSNASIVARFVTASPCTRRTIGTCVVTDCPSSLRESESSAGTISFTGGAIPLGTRLDPSADGTYRGLTFRQALLAEADIVVVSASGATVPAFHQQATGPGIAVVMSPACSAGGCGTIERGQDLPIAWIGGTDTVAVSLRVERGADGSTTTVCHFPASDGNGTVPAAALPPPPLDPGRKTAGTLWISSVAITRFTVGMIPGELMLASDGRGGDLVIQ